jgi:SAM-dependent methyltransferase
VIDGAAPDPSELHTHTTLRQLLARHALGSGIEVGPGHQPFALPFRGSSVRYVDRWHPVDNRRLFPELGEDATFPVPDVVANFDTDGLRPIADASQDFVICSHVLEHLAEPIGFLEEIHRVLRPGGIAILLLPNRHRTFDSRRLATSLDHLIAEHRAHIAEVDDEHVVEFLSNTIGISEDPGERQAALELHRNRSIHVHCWNEDEFVPVLEHCIEQCGTRWEFVDGLVTDDLGEEGFEFGFVLRRSTSTLDSSVLAVRFVQSWQAWRTARLVGLGELHAARSNLMALNVRVVELQAGVAERDAALARIHESALYRGYRMVRRLSSRLDGWLWGSSRAPRID